MGERVEVRRIARTLGSPQGICLLCLALPQIWLWTMLRAIDVPDSASVTGASTLAFYLAEGATLAAVALALRGARAYRARSGRPLGDAGSTQAAGRTWPTGASVSIRVKVTSKRQTAGDAAACATGDEPGHARPLPVRLAAWVAVLLMAVAPGLVLVGACAKLSGLVIGAEVVGAAGLAACYATYFALLASLPARDAMRALLLSFAIVPLVRLPLDLMPIAVAAPLVGVLPPFYLLALRGATRAATDAVSSQLAAISIADAEDRRERRRHIVVLGIELVAFGLAMGLFRVDAGGIHDSLWFVLLNCALKTAVPLLALVAIEHWGQQVSLLSLCQAALALLTVLMVIAVNLQGVPAVPFVVFDLARYTLVILIFLALGALGHRQPAPTFPGHPAAPAFPLGLVARPVALFAAGLGAYTLSLATGLAAQRALGTGGPDSATLVLDVVCVLVVCTMLAAGVTRTDDVRLFADGSPELTPMQPPDEIDACCEAVGRAHGLSERELDTMKLICRGRSKRYIAEQMALSENTVRGYAKTLYAKLDIHSRQELMTLVGVE